MQGNNLAGGHNAVAGGEGGSCAGWKRDTCKRHKGFTGVGAGAANLWLGISVLLNVQCVCADLKGGHSVLLMPWEEGRLWPCSGIVPPLCFGLAC